MIDDTTRDRPLPSGRFVLRIDPGLHASLRGAARAADRSLNEYCARKLAGPGLWLGGAAAKVVGRAACVLGDSLVGVVAFGSWARGDHSLTSDVDVLMIAEDSLEISRDLYRRWDAKPALSWQGSPVEPHFVSLPPESAANSGFWAEVAMDGLVLFERRLIVSRLLINVRRRILAGQLSRRFASGQPYWVRAGS